jgi:hypothetical protein
MNRGGKTDQSLKLGSNCQKAVLSFSYWGNFLVSNFNCFSSFCHDAKEQNQYKNSISGGNMSQHIKIIFSQLIDRIQQFIIFALQIHPMTHLSHTLTNNWWRRWLMHIVA